MDADLTRDKDLKATFWGGRVIWDDMANNRAPIPDSPEDRRDVIHEGSSLSGSTKRDNDATEKAIHPQVSDQLPTPSEEAADANRNNEEVVDQDPGERQKRNQGGEKEDPLAA
jgi:hypothetical protein